MKVCSCATIFKFFYGPQDFLLGENLYQKLLILATVSPHSGSMIQYSIRILFLKDMYAYPRALAHICKAITVKFGVRMRTGESLPTPNFRKTIA